MRDRLPPPLAPARARAILRALLRGEATARPLGGSRTRGFRIARAPARHGPPAPEDARVAAWVGAGRANKEIAAELGVSSTSAARAVARVCHLFGLARRLDLALLVAALEHARRGQGATPITRERAAPRGTTDLLVDLRASVAWARLTARQRTVVALALAGGSARRIARHRGERSPRTIENQLTRAFQALGISGRAQLVARLFARSEAPPPSSPRDSVRQ